jgi:hypothetical protein
LSHTPSPFCSGYFGDGILRTFCSGWPPTLIFPISVFQVARITGYPRTKKIHVHIKTCTWTYIVALFVMAGNWKQLTYTTSTIWHSGHCRWPLLMINTVTMPDCWYYTIDPISFVILFSWCYLFKMQSTWWPNLSHKAVRGVSRGWITTHKVLKLKAGAYFPPRPRYLGNFPNLANGFPKSEVGSQKRLQMSTVVSVLNKAN